MPTPVVRRSPDPAPPLTAGLPAPASQRHPRLDTHPAALTLFQIIAILLAFNAFPRHKCTDQAKPRDPWHSKLHRSFRASAFGD
jgi:hypothetical protein